MAFNSNSRFLSQSSFPSWGSTFQTIHPGLALEKDFSLLISTTPNKQGPFPLLLLLLALPHPGFPSWEAQWVLMGSSSHTLGGKSPSFGTSPVWDEAKIPLNSASGGNFPPFSEVFGTKWAHPSSGSNQPWAEFRRSRFSCGKCFNQD